MPQNMPIRVNHAETSGFASHGVIMTRPHFPSGMRVLACQLILISTQPPALECVSSGLFFAVDECRNCGASAHPGAEFVVSVAREPK